MSRYRYRTVTTPCLGVVVDWRFELGSALGPEVVEARAVDGGEELPRTHPIYGVLEALLEREPRNPLGALDELERELEDRRVIAQESRALGMEASC